MELKLTDREAVAIKHALQEYLKDLEGRKGGDQKGLSLEKESVRSAIEKMDSVSQAPGM
ncbi:MAG: hypothetical protein Kow0025_23310 [Thermodesulfovibrionales bacterium]